ncbi:MAG TPA: DUF992 domain-containing protein [Xanthobacteraceae bacterium]|nr:DUF992 domain-containing protein [Xanthobacteraceae bacterium]
MSLVMKSLAVAAAAIALAGGTASAQQAVAAGSLTCDVSAGFGVIIGSRKSVSCTLTPSQPGPVEYYTGTITRLGVDIGATTAGVLVWAVFAPTSRPVGALAGNYVGATGEATVGVGVGANVLVGGSNRSISLQPLSVSGQQGLNVAGGVAELELRFVR